MEVTGARIGSNIGTELATTPDAVKGLSVEQEILTPAITDTKTVAKDPSLGGKPLKYPCPEEFGNKIVGYFDYVRDEEQHPSVLGLCVYLDIHRSTLVEYGSRPAYSNTIKKAKDFIELYHTNYLYSGKNPIGAIFNLKCNYGWKDTQHIESNNTHTINIQIQPYSED